MINPEDEVIFDHRLSCTEEEAVAKLLGWMQGSKRLRYIAICDNSLSVDQFTHMYRLPSPISELIREERNVASIRFNNACAARQFDEAAKWEATVEYWDAINERAVRYKQGIADELCRRPKPRLISDKAMTDETGTHHITLSSLDYWARITYGKGISEQEQQTQATNLPAAPKRERVKGLERESAIIETITQLGISPEQLPPRLPGKSGVKAEVWKILEKRVTLFTSRKAFDKTWIILRSDNRIVESGCPPK
jgi:hypothetical protein